MSFRALLLVQQSLHEDINTATGNVNEPILGAVRSAVVLFSMLLQLSLAVAPLPEIYLSKYICLRPERHAGNFQKLAGSEFRSGSPGHGASLSGM